MAVLETSETDRKAQGIFKEVLLPWLAREQLPDHNIDFDVEVVENQMPTGIRFFAQLKGTKKSRFTKSHLSFSMQTGHLEYYLDHATNAVFLFVVDVIQREIYFLFIQKYLKENLLGKNWRKNVSVTLAIPFSQRFTSKGEFLPLVKAAEKYMRELRPSSVQAAAEAEKTRLQKLDDRFQVDVKYNDGKTQILVKPQQTFSLTVRLKNDEETKKKFRDLIEKGTPTEFNSDEINILGSPLLSEALEEPGSFPLTIHHQKTIKISYSLSLLDDSDVQTDIIYGLEGEIVSGTKQGIIRGAFPNSPFEFQADFEIGETAPIFKSEVLFGFHLDRWDGLPLLNLPYFEKIKLLATHFVAGKRMWFNFEKDGEQVTSFSLKYGETGSIKKEVMILELLAKSRYIAKKSGLNPSAGKVYEILENAEEIEELFDLLTRGEYRVKAPRATLKCEATFGAQFLEVAKRKGAPIVLTSNEPIPFFGKNVNIGPIKRTLSNMALRTKIDQSFTLGDTREMVWAGTPETEAISERMDPSVVISFPEIILPN